MRTDILNGASPFSGTGRGVQIQQSGIIKNGAENEPFFLVLSYRKHKKAICNDALWAMGPSSESTTVK